MPRVALAAPRRSLFALPTLLKPTLADLFLVSLIFWALFLNPVSLGHFMGDAGLGVHIRTGEMILAQGRVPTTDPYSYSVPGGRWFAFEWLTGVVYGVLHQSVGLQAVAGFSALLLGLYGLLVLRDALSRGATALPAFLFTMLGFQAASIHYLARPHLFTMVLFAASVFAIERDRRGQDRWLWCLVPLAAIWANLHAAFLMLPVYAALVALGSLAERKVSASIRYGSLSILSLLASVLNPYGLELHQHVKRFVVNDWIARMVQEYAPATSFREERIYVYFALAALGVAAAAWMALRQRRYVEPLLILFFVYISMRSVRHITLFVVVVMPLLSVLATQLLESQAAQAARSSLARIVRDISRDMTPAFARNSLWLAAIALVLTLDLARLFPTTFPEGEDGYPVALLERHADTLSSTRLYTTDHWADYLLYKRFPKQRVFVDGRSDYFGRQMGEEYLTMLYAEPGWQNLFAKWRFETALLPADNALVKPLSADPDWRVLDRVPGAVLLVRRSVQDVR